jgi:predicted RNA polymerase sigma factor
MAIACRILRDVDLAEHAVQAALVTAWLGEQIRQIVESIRFE